MSSTTSHAEISKSRSKKKPFKLIIKAGNGEPIDSAQLLTSKLNCHKNLIALMKWANGSSGLVVDKTVTPHHSYILHDDGFKENNL